MTLHPLIRRELDALELQFPGQAYLTLDDYAALYKIKRKDAAQHLHRRGIKCSKEGRSIYINILDLATYKAQRKNGTEPLSVGFQGTVADEMRNRRGFFQLAQRKQLEAK